MSLVPSVTLLNVLRIAALKDVLSSTFSCAVELGNN